MIALITEWTSASGEVQRRDEESDLGGTMRLGAQECRLKAGSLARAVRPGRGARAAPPPLRVQQPVSAEVRGSGLVIGGKSMDDLLVEMVELPLQQHPWFLACQFHPEFTSTRAQRPSAVHRLRAGRARIQGGAHGVAPGGKRVSMNLCGLRGRAGPAAVPIAGPCVIESLQLQLDTAGKLKEMTSRLGVPFIFKSSFDKANRTSARAFRGPGLEEGLKVLAEVKRQIGVPVLTDVHEYTPMNEVAAVVDVLQTPAFLCRQTDFIQAVARAGKPVNIKKGQFLALGNEARRRQGKSHRQRADHGVRTGASFGYNNSCRTCAASR